MAGATKDAQKCEMCETSSAKRARSPSFDSEALLLDVLLPDVDELVSDETEATAAPAKLGSLFGDAELEQPMTPEQPMSPEQLATMSSPELLWPDWSEEWSLDGLAPDEEAELCSKLHVAEETTQAGTAKRRRRRKADVWEPSHRRRARPAQATANAESHDSSSDGEEVLSQQTPHADNTVVQKPLEQLLFNQCMAICALLPVPPRIEELLSQEVICPNEKELQHMVQHMVTARTVLRQQLQLQVERLVPQSPPCAEQ
jgi:hypothetical protein